MFTFYLQKNDIIQLFLFHFQSIFHNENKVCTTLKNFLFVTIIAVYKQILNRKVQRVMW